MDFNGFWRKYSRQNWPLNDRSNLYLSQRLFPRYLQKSEQAKYALKWTKNVGTFYLCGSVDPNSPDLSQFTYSAVSYSSVSIRCRVGMSMNSRSDWLKSGA